MKLIDKLSSKVEELNLEYIGHNDLDLNQYRAMIAELLIDCLLIELGYEIDENTKGFSFYSDLNIGYTGYITLHEKTIFFAPTKVIVMDKE